MLFVLTTIEGKAERPVAVVDNEKIANDWIAENPKNNWIPFELNDLDMADHDKAYTQFKSKGEPPAVTEQKKRDEQQAHIESLQRTVQNLTNANKEMEKYLKRNKLLASVKSALFKRASVYDQIHELMEKRSFNEEDKGNNWAIFSRNTEYAAGDGIRIKVYWKGNTVLKTDMLDPEPGEDGVLTTRLGWEGLNSFAQTYGD